MTIIKYILISISILFSASPIYAYFYANSMYHLDSVVAPMNIYGSGFINGYYLGTATSAANTPLPVGRMLFTPALVSTGTKQYYVVETERGYFGHCSLDSYSGATKVGFGFYCPTARVYSNLGSDPILLSTTGATGATGSIGATGATGGTGATGATGSIGATGSMIIESNLILTGSEIFSGASFSLNNDDATLDASGTYLPLFAKKDGQILLNYEATRNALLMLLLTFITLFIIFKVTKGKSTYS